MQRYTGRCQQLWLRQSVKTHVLLAAVVIAVLVVARWRCFADVSTDDRPAFSLALSVQLLTWQALALSAPLLWAQRQYNKPTSAQPLLSWAIIAVFNVHSLCAYLIYMISAGCLSYKLVSTFALSSTLLQPTSGQGLWNPSFIRFCAILNLTVLSTQTSHLLFPNNRPQFASSRGLRRFWSVDNLSRDSVTCLRHAFSVCFLLWTTQLLGLQPIYYIIVHLCPFLKGYKAMEPTPRSWLTSIRHFLSPIEFIVSVLLISVILFIWKLSINIQQLMITPPVIASENISELIQVLKTAQKPVVQHYAFQELALISAQIPSRRTTIYRDEVDSFTWSQVLQACTTKIIGLTESIHHELILNSTKSTTTTTTTTTDSKSINNPPSIKIVSNLSLNPTSHSSTSVRLSKQKLTRPSLVIFLPIYRILQASYSAIIDEFHRSSLVNKQPSSQLFTSTTFSSDIQPLVPRFDDTRKSTPTTSSNDPTSTLLVKSQSLTQPTYLQQQWNTYIRQPVLTWVNASSYHEALLNFFLKIRLTYVLLDYQLTYWSVQSLSTLIVHSRVEDPYGIVYKSIPNTLDTLFKLSEQLNQLHSRTLFLAWPTRHLGLLLPRRRMLSLNNPSLFFHSNTRSKTRPSVNSSAAIPSHMATTDEFDALLERLDDGIPRKVIILYDAIDNAVYQIVSCFHEYLVAEGMSKLDKLHQPLLRKYLEKIKIN